MLVIAPLAFHAQILIDVIVIRQRTKITFRLTKTHNRNEIESTLFIMQNNKSTVAENKSVVLPITSVTASLLEPLPDKYALWPNFTVKCSLKIALPNVHFQHEG